MAKEKSSLANMGEDHGRCEELGIATLKNLSGYGERHVKKVINGTGDTLLITFLGSKAESYKCKRNGGWMRGVGGGHSTENDKRQQNVI
ncbi:hypothetical protein KDJ21_022710 [Metabacillus litoralis]|uniref:hypothetical protein n=1 Tax=Metabacillus litoralis TaxID=152268 RepID=UPI001E48059C|nr:hypothetical protein [Metabacillus litoralis]UHA58764.1 hypothetical protein KDJ21_018290 [Metabacillus litoralis]UHA59553.1 hypothetical protein KDJ21_022710 [Metabacillus litoralis]